MLAIPNRVRPGLGFLPPARLWLLAFARPGSWLYVKMLGVRRIEVEGMESLVRLLRDQQEGRSRFIVAYRHPTVDDPGVMFRLLCGLAGPAARRLGLRLRRAPRGHFLYGRDVPEWSGQWLTWFLPHIGAISVFPGKVDTASLSVIRRILTDAPHPIALAPEGQVSYHDGIIGPLEHGTAQMAFWCQEDLRRQGRTEDVFVLPVGLSYHYGSRDWRGVDRLLDRIETVCGLPPLEVPAGETPRARVMRVASHLVGTAESHYTRWHGIVFPPVDPDGDAEALQRRIAAVVEAALGVAERAFGVRTQGDWVQRVQTLRYAGLGRMHRDDIEDPSRLPPLDRALADRVAAEAWLSQRHIELVDLLEYVRMDYLTPGAGIDRYAEMTTNLWDLANRLQGGNISGRVAVGRRTCRVFVGEPIAASRYWDSYKANRRRGVASLTDEIRRSLRQAAERAQT